MLKGTSFPTCCLVKQLLLYRAQLARNNALPVCHRNSAVPMPRAALPLADSVPGWKCVRSQLRLLLTQQQLRGGHCQRPSRVLPAEHRLWAVHLHHVCNSVL